jgi:2-dehydro-3-deoxyphosphogluconate aldolase/(4S)-4-hydroxy-2-oxoglutarate aldolase
MHSKEKIIRAIIEQGALPLYFHPEETISVRVLEALYESGIRVVEYTNRGKLALKNFKILKKTATKKFKDLILGLGTVLDSKTVFKGIESGADFLVSPGYSETICKTCLEQRIFWIPGCMTPSDLMQARDSGISLVKIFPGHSIGPGFIKSVKEVFPDLLFMPTGGVNNENLKDWFKAGVSAVGMGSSLITKFIMDNNEFDFLKTNTKELLLHIAAIRSSL